MKYASSVLKYVVQAVIVAVLAIGLIGMQGIGGKAGIGGQAGLGGGFAQSSPTAGIPTPPLRYGLVGWNANASGFEYAGTLGQSSGGWTLVCTTASFTGASATAPSTKTCASGATANTTLSMAYTGADSFIGTSSNPTNMEVIVSGGGQNGTTTVRSWFAVISNATPATLGTTDSPTTKNVAGIRFSSVAGDTNFSLVLCNSTAGACSVTSTGAAGDTALHTFSVSLNDATGTATGCVGTTCVNATTDYPGTVAVSGAGIVVDNTSTTSLIMSMSQIYIQSNI